MTKPNIAQLNDTNFDEYIKTAEKPVLVDFWAEWCGPCKMIAPILEQIAAEEEARVGIAKLNVDDSLEVARRYEVMSIPTLILFKDGKVAKRIVGAMPKSSLLRELNPHLS
ncbi:thioredoxin [Ferrithrix thermotolerans DSM 19514]|jgi:thioredoxin 1|uniref:Thioredoxin n=1 Tax=Ferrithrix thermotolerans DSM 19514 TaxID=1121881 RepID=A0A1M4WZV1_9ACTN|nr:thioredoxin [Ferrithrix thermotolerans]SHE86791.1 thioredoxin [Ferrithrix thermotolerans DSM 19514]